MNRAYEVWIPGTETWSNAELTADEVDALTHVHSKHVNDVLYDIMQDPRGNWFRRVNGNQ